MHSFDRFDVRYPSTAAAAAAAAVPQLYNQQSRPQSSAATVRSFVDNMTFKPVTTPRGRPAVEGLDAI